MGGEAEAIVGVIAAAPGAIAPGAMAEGDTLPIWDWGICMGHANGPQTSGCWVATFESALCYADAILSMRTFTFAAFMQGKS